MFYLLGLLQSTTVVALFLLAVSTAQAQPRAIIADGPGPWQDAQWTFAASELRSLLVDAGYSVEIVAPPDLQAALNSPDILLAFPSLEVLPLPAFSAIAAHMVAGGSLMATGAEPFRRPLYRSPDGQWLDRAMYTQAVGSAPADNAPMPPTITSISPRKEQYVARNGLRVPVLRQNSSGRLRSIGDVLLPSATIAIHRVSTFAQGVFTTKQGVIAWLPWPRLNEPHRSELIAALQAASAKLAIESGGTDLMTYLPGEAISGSVAVMNGSALPANATLRWSIESTTGISEQPEQAITISAGRSLQEPIAVPNFPSGEYKIRFRLFAGERQVDELKCLFRIVDPRLTRQPDQKIRVVNGAFEVAGRHIFLRGVNYWPRFVSGQNIANFNGRSWLEPGVYDPEVIEADLAQIASLGFNLLQIQFIDFAGYVRQSGRSLIDFLERCRNHSLWVQIFLQTTLTNSAYAGQISPKLQPLLQSAFLPGNDRVFAYELLWEPFMGTHDKGGQGRITNGQISYDKGRTFVDSEWRLWVDQQYGSLANAEAAWGVVGPRDNSGQLTNPLDDQVQNDGPWRVMVAAYRRFLDDYLGRNIGEVVRSIRNTDPDALITYRNWTTMSVAHNNETGYDIGAGVAHLDFVSPEQYSPLRWPDIRNFGLVTAYARLRSGGKPVVWAEYGGDIGSLGGTVEGRASQSAICDGMMRQVSEDGSNGASVWWWPGGDHPQTPTDYGIIEPDGTPRECARILARWNQTFAAAPPDLTTSPSTTLTIDRDTDARGSYGLFLNHEARYIQLREAGQSVKLATAGTGTDTASMPLTQVGNMPYSGTGPLKFANGEFAGIRVQCPTLDVVVENGATLTIPPGASCQLTPTLVNIGEAAWLASSAPARGVTLHTNLGDLSLPALASLQRTTPAPLMMNMPQSSFTVSGRLRIAGVGEFGETLSLRLELDSGTCPVTLNPALPASIAATGASASLAITAPSTCMWGASSSQPWLSLSPASNTGNSSVTYTVQPNYGPQRIATVRIADRAFTITQAGAATPPAAPAPSLSTTTMVFPAQPVGSPSDPHPLQLTNSGTTALNFAGFTIGAANSADFRATHNCPTTLLPASSCSVQVTFTPNAPGPRSATLHIAGNLASGSSAIALTGAGTVAGPVPAIQAIVDAWGYTPGIAPGLWVTIGGTNLASVPQTWNLANTRDLPAALGATSVTFNGTPAALLYTSPTQINALVPAILPPGPVQVIVTANGVASAPFAMTAQAAHPAVYAPPTADGSTFHVTAALAGTATLIGNSATDPRVLRAARPGELLDLYLIGLGGTQDPAQFITDKVFSGAHSLSAPITASLGGRPAEVVFSGLTSPGLYLVRIRVPQDASTGPQPLQISAGGALTRSALMLQIAP